MPMIAEGLASGLASEAECDCLKGLDGVSVEILGIQMQRMHIQYPPMHQCLHSSNKHSAQPVLLIYLYLELLSGPCIP